MVCRGWMFWVLWFHVQTVLQLESHHWAPLFISSEFLSSPELPLLHDISCCHLLPSHQACGQHGAVPAALGGCCPLGTYKPFGPGNVSGGSPHTCRRSDEVLVKSDENRIQYWQWLSPMNYTDLDKTAIFFSKAPLQRKDLGFSFLWWQLHLKGQECIFRSTFLPCRCAQKLFELITWYNCLSLVWHQGRRVGEKWSHLPVIRKPDLFQKKLPCF